MKKMTMIVSAILTAAMLVTPMSAFAVDLPAPQFDPYDDAVQQAVGSDNTLVPKGWINGENAMNDTPYNLLDGQEVHETDRGRAKVVASVSPTYTVTIPTYIRLDAVNEGTDAGKFEGKFPIKASNVFLEEGKGIMVSLEREERNEFTMTAEYAEGYRLGYTVTSEVYRAVDNDNRKLAIFATDNDLGLFSAMAEGSNDYMNALEFIQRHYDTNEKEFRESVTIQTEKPRYAGVYSDTVTFNISVAPVQGEALNAFNSVGQLQNAQEP